MKNKKLKHIVQIELSKFDAISLSERRLTRSKVHKNLQYSCFPFHRHISKYGKPKIQ